MHNSKKPRCVQKDSFFHLGCFQEIVQRLLAVTSELLSAKARMHGSTDPSETVPAVGTLDNSIASLQEYCSDLENRVVQRFDQYTNASNREGMKECACIMAKLDKEMVLAKVTLQIPSHFILLSEIHLFQANVYRYQRSSKRSTNWISRSHGPTGIP